MRDSVTLTKSVTSVASTFESGPSCGIQQGMEQLETKTRMDLMKFVCSFAWTDLKVTDQERAKWGVPPLAEAKKREKAMNTPD